MSGNHKSPLYKSFAYAIAGIIACVRQERNMRIHLTAAILVTAAGTLFRISAAEWIVCLILFGLVMSLELVNTALEAAVDLVTQEQKPLAKKAKDAAAGAVLVSAVMAAIIGLIIFLPKIFAIL